MPTWTFVRHGQSVANAEAYFAGQTDSPLTAHGERQAIEARARLDGVTFSRVLVSDLSRARRTAELLLEGFPHPHQHHRELRERYCGTWEKRPFSEAALVGDLELFRSWTGRPPDGESLRDVAERAMSFLHQRDDGHDTLVVCHGALMRAVIGVIDRTPVHLIGQYKPVNLEFVSRSLPPGGFGALVGSLP